MITRTQFEVLDSVISPVSVFVMNGFIGKEFSFKKMRHDCSVLEHSFIGGYNRIWIKFAHKASAKMDIAFSINATPS